MDSNRLISVKPTDGRWLSTLGPGSNNWVQSELEGVERPSWSWKVARANSYPLQRLFADEYRIVAAGKAEVLTWRHEESKPKRVSVPSLHAGRHGALCDSGLLVCPGIAVDVESGRLLDDCRERFKSQGIRVLDARLQRFGGAVLALANSDSDGMSSDRGYLRAVFDSTNLEWVLKTIPYPNVTWSDEHCVGFGVNTITGATECFDVDFCLKWTEKQILSDFSESAVSPRPQLVGDTVYLFDSVCGWSGLSVYDGHLVSSFDRRESDEWGRVVPTHAGPSAIFTDTYVVIDGVVREGTGNKGIECYSLDLGELIWRLEKKGGGDLGEKPFLSARLATPIVAVGTLLIIATRYGVIALDVPSGKLIGILHESFQPTRAIADGQRLIMSNDQFQLECLSLRPIF